jgi:hypothetical protein
MTLDSQPPLTQHAPLVNATFPAIEKLSGTMWPYRKTNDKRLKQKKTRKEVAVVELPNMHLGRKWRLLQVIRAH